MVEDNEKELEQIGEEKKVVGDGTCTRFSREELDKVLGDFDGTHGTAPGLTSLVEMELGTGDCSTYHTTPIPPTGVLDDGYCRGARFPACSGNNCQVS